MKKRENLNAADAAEFVEKMRTPEIEDSSIADRVQMLVILRGIPGHSGRTAEAEEEEREKNDTLIREASQLNQKILFGKATQNERLRFAEVETQIFQEEYDALKKHLARGGHLQDSRRVVHAESLSGESLSFRRIPE